MNKYQVTVVSTVTEEFEIEARDEIDAEQEALNKTTLENPEVTEIEEL